MASGQVWNFSGIQSQVSELEGEASKVKEDLEKERQEIQNFGDAWSGSAGDAWKQEEAKWDAKADALTEALNKLVSTIEEASSAMQQTESEVGGMFH